MQKKSNTTSVESKNTNPLAISNCCKVNYISDGQRVYCSMCKKDCRQERQKKLIDLYNKENGY